MGTGNLTINLKGIANNWRILDTISDDQVETAAVVKADGYGLNAGRIARSLYEVGARVFFVAAAEEAAAVRLAHGREGPGDVRDVDGQQLVDDGRARGRARVHERRRVDGGLGVGPGERRDLLRVREAPVQRS